MSIDKEGQIDIQSEIPSKDYEKILGQIDVIISDQEGVSDKKMEEFVKSRTETLTEKSKTTHLSAAGGEHSFYDGFIRPDANIRSSFLVDPFRLDDNSIYPMLLETMKELKNGSGKGKEIRRLTSTAIMITLARYFGNAYTLQNTEARNREIYSEKTESDDKFISIKEFKDKGVAVCVEKATMAQNLLQFVGLDSFIIFSSKCRSAEEEKEDLHAYNIISSDNGYSIFDPTNPSLQIDELSKFPVSYYPAMYRISKEQFNEIKNGGTVEVTHRNFSILEDGATKIDESKRIYGGPSK